MFPTKVTAPHRGGKARTLDAAAEHADHDAERLNRPHTFFACAMIFLQIAISLASITPLTERQWLLWVAFISAFAGAGLCGWALLIGG